MPLLIFLKKKFFVLHYHLRLVKLRNGKQGFTVLRGASVPVVMATLDFGQKQIKISKPYVPTDNMEKDLPILIRFQGSRRKKARTFLAIFVSVGEKMNV